MSRPDELANRIEELSPDRRALVERLARLRAGEAGRGTPPRSAPKPLVFDLGDGSLGEAKAGYRRFYDQVSRQLDSSEYGAFSVFLNYGYVAGDQPQFAPFDLPEHWLNRNSAKLVLELVGPAGLDGRDVLDIGCGRGGTLATLDSFFAPRSLTGIDLSAEAIAFCRGRHTGARFKFYEGDAEALGFEDGGFDVVTNVESSHTYPDRARFYAEIRRVLRAPGRFLYTDLLPVEEWALARETLPRVGLEIVHDRDITPNVLLSCDQIARTRMQAFEGGNDASLMRDFLAAPGSSVYDSMSKRSWEYRILWCDRS